jgi:galactokinase
MSRWHRAQAPGRVNLIGEHTDYNDGYVLPSAIPQRTTVELRPTGDAGVRVRSAALPADAEQAFTVGHEAPGRGWLDYVQGVVWALRRAGFLVGGFEASIRSDVPMGSGLASSAALEVALLRALRDAFALDDLDDVRLAHVAQDAENGFVGARVGIMDQMASSLAAERTALFLDTRSLAFERVPLPARADLVVINSGIAHGHAGGEYNRRRAECEAAARLLGVPALRDVATTDLDRVAALPPPLDRRARHVVTEDQRVLEAVAALRAGDLAALGGLLDASHASLRDDFEVSIPPIDALVALAQAEPAVFGARLTGGGFGGSVVLLARRGEGRAVGDRLRAAYGERTGQTATVLMPPSDTPSA